MKSLLGILASIGLVAGCGAILPTTAITATNFNSEYSSILVDVSQDVSVSSKNSEGAHHNNTEDIRFSDIQTELHMDYEAFLKANFNIRAIGLFRINTHLNGQQWPDVEFKKESSTENETKYVVKLHHEAQNGWAKQKGDIKIVLTIKVDNSMLVKTDVSAESYGSVSSTLTGSALRGLSFK